MTTLTFSFRHLSSLLLLGAGLQQLHGVFGRPPQLQGPDGEVRQGPALHEGPAARGNGSSRRRHHQSRPDHWQGLVQVGLILARNLLGFFDIFRPRLKKKVWLYRCFVINLLYFSLFFRGELSGKSGIFPASFVRIIDSFPGSSPPEHADTKPYTQVIRLVKKWFFPAKYYLLGRSAA